MIKLLLINVGSIFGGIERYTLDLLEVLPKDMFEVHVAVRDDGLLRERLVLDKDRILALPMGKKDILASMISLKRYVKTHNIQIVHCNSNNAMLVASLIRDGVDGVKKIAAIHGDVLIDQAAKGKIIAELYCWLETALLKRYRHCIAVSRSMKSVLVDRGVEESAIKVIHNSIIPMDYEQLPEYYANPLRICNVGNLLLPKGQMTLLKAICLLRDAHPEVNISCDIYGEGPCRGALERYISENDLQGISLRGFCNNVRSELNSYAVYVQPSLYESFGIALIEAMNAGCCVVASAVGGMKEIIENGKTGFLFEPENAEQLAQILYECYTSRERAELVGQAGSKAVLDRFTVIAMGKRMQDYYREIVG